MTFARAKGIFSQVPENIRGQAADDLAAWIYDNLDHELLVRYGALALAYDCNHQARTTPKGYKNPKTEATKDEKSKPKPNKTRTALVGFEETTAGQTWMATWPEGGTTLDCLTLEQVASRAQSARMEGCGSMAKADFFDWLSQQANDPDKRVGEVVSDDDAYQRWQEAKSDWGLDGKPLAE